MENIYSVAKPFYILAKVLGIFPMALNDRKNVFKVKWLNLAYSFLTLSVPLGLNICNVLSGNSYELWLMTIWKTLAIFGVSLITLLYFYQFSKRQEIAMFLKAIDRFDQQVGKVLKLNVLMVIFFLFSSGESFERRHWFKETKKIHSTADNFVCLPFPCFRIDSAYYLQFLSSRSNIHEFLHLSASLQLFLRCAVFMCSFGSERKI